MGNICGSLTWTLTYQDGSPQDLVSFQSNDLLVFAPQMFHAPGDYFFTLKATLSPTQVGTHDFVGTVLECVPVIESSAAASNFFSTLDITWGFPTVDFDITNVITAYS